MLEGDLGHCYFLGAKGAYMALHRHGIFILDKDIIDALVADRNTDMVYVLREGLRPLGRIWRQLIWKAQLRSLRMVGDFGFFFFISLVYRSGSDTL